MGNGYTIPARDAIDQLVQRLEQYDRRISESEMFTGAEIAETVRTLQELVDGLIEQTEVNVTGGVTAGGNGSFGGTLTATGAIYNPHGLANPVTSGYFAAYINGDARIGRTVSSRRYKQNIKTWRPDTQAFFALRLVTYRLRTAVGESGVEAPVEWGLIAEELVDLGLDWLVIFIDGKPEGVAYEKIGLALLPIVQEQEARIRALEEQVAALVADRGIAGG